MVTFKLTRPEVKHNPWEKRTDVCPLGDETTCTDVTGAHHTVIFVGDERLTCEDVAFKLSTRGHVTRVEEVRAFEWIEP